MSMSANQIDIAFDVLGLPPPSAPLLSTLETIVEDQTSVADILALPQVQALDYLIVQMFELATGHDPTAATLSSIASSALTPEELASAFVASQSFANVYNGGAPMNPNAPASEDFVDALFLNGLGHAPTAATEAGFAGLTNAQVFLDFAMSPTMTAAHASQVTASLTNIVELATSTKIFG
jgi:hypothetical protein